MPNRLLKETIRTSKKVNALSDFLFRIWIYLITYVDDYGRGSADPELLKGFVFPRRKGVTEQQIDEALRNLASSGMIQLYNVDGESYFCFPNWDKHQQMRAKKSKFPEPDNSGYHVISDDCKCPRNPNPNPNTESETNPMRENTRAREDDEDAGFDAFWTAYPRKSGDIKGAYMEYLHALDIGATPDQILAALKWQADEWIREGQPQFIPSPEKWLMNRRWEEKPRDSARGDTSNIFLKIAESGGLDG